MMNFNGRTLPSWARVIDIKRPLLPPSGVVSSSIIGRSGTFLFSKRLEAKKVRVFLRINASNKAIFRQRVRELAHLLHTEDEARLVFTDEPDKYVNALIIDDSDIDETPVFGDVEVKFYCPNPFWYAINDNIFTFTSTGTHNLPRAGTAPSNPLITVRGTSTAANGRITFNANSGQQVMAYQGVLASNQTLVIDSELMTAFIENTNGSRTAVLNRLTTLNFIVLRSGANTLNISLQNDFTLQNVRVEARSRWL